MNQKSKNIKLLAVLALLTLITVAVILLGGGPSKVDFNRDEFTLNKNAVLTDVTLEGNGVNNSFAFQENHWVVNSKYAMDESMMNVFFTIVSSMQVLRPVGENQRDSIASLVKSTGLKVQIRDNVEVLKEYWIGGNEEKGISWCLGDDNIPYVVYLPGYQSYLAGIFDARENDWRDRRVFSGTWINTSKVSINMKDGEPLEMKSSSVVFQIEGYKTDTTLLMNYIENVLFLQADDFLDHSTSLEKLKNDTPIGTIQIEMIGSRKDYLSLYNMKDQKKVLGILNDTDFMVFDKRRVDALVKKKTDFNN